MKPKYYITVHNSVDNSTSFLKDPKGKLVLSKDNRKVPYYGIKEARDRIKKLQQRYAQCTHLSFSVRQVKFEDPELLFEKRPKPTKPERPWTDYQRLKECRENQYKIQKEQTLERLKNEAKPDSVTDTRLVNLSDTLPYSSKVDCRHCGVCRDCLERMGK
jgi:hypothetical protein